MPVPTTTDDFLGLLRRSGMIDGPRLEQFIHQDLAISGATAPTDVGDLLIAGGLLTHFQTEQLLLGKYRGFTIGKYKVLERLGFGGGGTVYLCEHQVVRRRVAVKVLPNSKADNPAALGRFYREARAAGVLDHPNLVKAHDVDRDDDSGLHFLVMDYVDGSSLQYIVGKFGSLAVGRACHYVRQAAQGLDHAHQAGLIHRDVKPANILLDRQGLIRILDLGLARFFHDETDQLTLKYDEKNVLGTADYVSPEQALNSHSVDIRTDVYSLGATFYFCLTGQPPFPGGKAAQKLIWHQVRQPTPVRDLRPEVPPGLALVVHKMLAKDAAQRYQTPAEVVAALTPWTRTPVGPPPEAEMPRLSPAALRQTGESDGGSATPAPGGRPSSLAGNRTPTTPIPSVHGDARQPSRAAGRPEVPPRAPSRALPVSPSGIPIAEIAPPAPPPLSPNSRALRLATILLLGAAMGVTMRWAVAWMTRPGAVPCTMHTVSRCGQSGTFPTVLAALLAAKPGDRVVVRDEAWEEALELSDDLGKGVRVEAGVPGDKPVVWRAPMGHLDTTPLIRINGVDGVTFKGFVFDGQDRLRDLVLLSGPCPGLTLEQLSFTGFQRNGVVLRGCGGDPTRPVQMREVRFVPGRPAGSAVFLEADADAANKHVRIQDSRLEGPYQAAVTIAGPALGLEMQRNRVFNAVDGILYRRETPLAPLELKLVANTFYDLERVGLHFETSPPVEDSRVTVEGNLFGHTATLARIDDFTPQPRQATARWVWTDDLRTGREAPQTEQRFFRRAFAVEGAVARAELNVVADTAFVVWVNGEKVCTGEMQSRIKKVWSVDVTKHLRAGSNAVAVQVTAKNGPGGLLAQLTYACAGGMPETVSTDAGWKAAKDVPAGWQQTGFDDSRWPAAKVVADYGQGPAGWQNLVWLGVVREHFQGRALDVFPEPTGNVRDPDSAEGFPALKAASMKFELPIDPTDDARFLRYGRASMLGLAGSPGVPPAEKQKD